MRQLLSVVIPRYEGHEQYPDRQENIDFTTSDEIIYGLLGLIIFVLLIINIQMIVLNRRQAKEIFDSDTENGDIEMATDYETDQFSSIQ